MATSLRSIGTGILTVNGRIKAKNFAFDGRGPKKIGGDPQTNDDIFCPSGRTNNDPAFSQSYIPEQQQQLWLLRSSR